MKEAQLVAFARLQAIDWAATGRGAFDELTYQLFFDYAATATAICRRHGLEGHFYRRLNGLFDYVPRLAGELAPLPDEIDRWCTQDLTELYRWRSRSYVIPAAVGFVMWDGLNPAMQEHIVGHAAAPNPYDQFISFLERGGAFTCEHNMLDRVLPEPPDKETISRLASSATPQA